MTTYQDSIDLSYRSTSKMDLFVLAVQSIRDLQYFVVGVYVLWNIRIDLHFFKNKDM